MRINAVQHPYSSESDFDAEERAGRGDKLQWSKGRLVLTSWNNVLQGKSQGTLKATWYFIGLPL